MRIARNSTSEELQDKRLVVLAHMATSAEMARREDSSTEFWTDNYRHWAQDLKRIEKRLQTQVSPN